MTLPLVDERRKLRADTETDLDSEAIENDKLLEVAETLTVTLTRVSTGSAEPWRWVRRTRQPPPSDRATAPLRLRIGVPYPDGLTVPPNPDGNVPEGECGRVPGNTVGGRSRWTWWWVTRR